MPRSGKQVDHYTRGKIIKQKQPQHGHIDYEGDSDSERERSPHRAASDQSMATSQKRPRLESEPQLMESQGTGQQETMTERAGNGGGNAIAGYKGAYVGDGQTNEGFLEKYNEFKEYHSRQSQCLSTSWVSTYSSPPANAITSNPFGGGYTEIYSDVGTQSVIDGIMTYPINWTANKFVDRKFYSQATPLGPTFAAMFNRCRLMSITVSVSAKSYVCSGINQAPFTKIASTNPAISSPDINYIQYTNVVGSPQTTFIGYAGANNPGSTMVEIPMDYWVMRDVDNKFSAAIANNGSIPHDPSVAVSSPQIIGPVDRTFGNIRNEDTIAGIMPHNGNWSFTRKVNQREASYLSPSTMAVAMGVGNDLTTDYTGQNATLPNIQQLISLIEGSTPSTSTVFQLQTSNEGFNILIAPMNPPISYLPATAILAAALPPNVGLIPIVNLQTHFTVKYTACWNLWQYNYEALTARLNMNEVFLMREAMKEIGRTNRERFTGGTKNVRAIKDSKIVEINM